MAPHTQPNRTPPNPTRTNPVQPFPETNETSATTEPGSSEAPWSDLFTTLNCVQPEEKSEYDNLTSALWKRLAPADVLEELFAAEVCRFTWRLRRCVVVEATLAAWTRKNVHEDDIARLGHNVPDRQPVDPMMLSYASPTQAIVDLARSRAFAGLRRAMADLKALQTERFLRAELLPAHLDPNGLGLASAKEIAAAIATTANRTARRQTDEAQKQNEAKPEGTRPEPNTPKQNEAKTTRQLQEIVEQFLYAPIGDSQEQMEAELAAALEKMSEAAGLPKDAFTQHALGRSAKRTQSFGPATIFGQAA